MLIVAPSNGLGREKIEKGRGDCLGHELNTFFLIGAETRPVVAWPGATEKTWPNFAAWRYSDRVLSGLAIF
jgi:hypothetical protein